MSPDVKRLIAFYKSPLGRVARRLVREQVRALAGDVTGKRILGLGFATPYLRSMLAPAERVIAFMPARQGASAWPRESPSQTVLCDPLEMPLTDSAIDLVIAVHALEFAADTEEQMRELWRISAPDARLIIVAPRRRGLWAQRDNTPFGCGNPFSRPQLDQLLRTHSFTPEEWQNALYLPPSETGAIIRSARLFERAGRMSAPLLAGMTWAGVTVVKAKKEQYPAIARRQRARRVVRLPELAPQTALTS